MGNLVGNLVGKCCGRMLQEILDLDELNILKITFRNGLEKFLWENLAGNLVGNLAEKSYGKSCGKFLREKLAGNSRYR